VSDFYNILIFCVRPLFGEIDFKMIYSKIIIFVVTLLSNVAIEEETLLRISPLTFQNSLYHLKLRDR